MTWLPWLFPSTPNNFWNSTQNHRPFLKWVLKERGHELTKFHVLQLTDAVIKEYKGGANLLSQYPNAMECLRRVFPEYDFTLSDFNQAGRGFWSDPLNQRNWLLELGETLGFRVPTDWYSLRERDIEAHGGISLLQYYDSSPASAVLTLIPELQLFRENFSHVSKLQARAFGITSCLFLNKKVLFEFKHPEIIYPRTGRKLELDIFIPDRKLAIEIQGAQHYRPAWGGQEEFENIKKRDRFKRKSCKQLNIRLIEIRDDEWDGSVEHFIELLQAQIRVQFNPQSFYLALKKRGLLGHLAEEQLFWNKKRTKR